MYDIGYILKVFEKFLYNLIFFPIFDIPFLILWVFCGYFFCFIRSRAVNIRYFISGFAVLLGLNAKKNENDYQSQNKISHYQAFSTAIAGSVGLGSIAGSVFAVKMGGPGSLFWIMIVGLLSMSTKFFEVTLGFKYRTEDELGYLGGPFAYIKYAFERIGLIKFGKFSVRFYALIMIFNMLLSILFQSNQIVVVTKQINEFLFDKDIIISSFYAILISIIIFGGLIRISNFVSGLIPIMMVLYLGIVFYTIYYYKDNIISSLLLIITNAFSNEKSSIYGGIIGVIIIGIKRASYTCEAGTGNSSIAHSGTDEKYPAKVGFVAMVEPIFDTCIMCFLSGFVIIISKVYMIYPKVTGIELSVLAFESSNHYNLFLISICSILFGFSTIISYSYYLEIATTYLFGRNIKNTYIVRTISIIIISISACFDDASILVGMCDIFFVLLTVPNLMAIYLLSDVAILELKKYVKNCL